MVFVGTLRQNFVGVSKDHFRDDYIIKVAKCFIHALNTPKFQKIGDDKNYFSGHKNCIFPIYLLNKLIIKKIV